MSYVRMSHVEIRMSHVTHKKQTCHTYESVSSHAWYDTFNLHIRMRHVTQIRMSHVNILTSHVTQINKSCRIYEWVMSHIWTSHITQMNQSYHTHEWVVSHKWIRHVTHMNESCQTHEYGMSYIRASHVPQHIPIHIRFIQPLPFGVTFSKLFQSSKLKLERLFSLKRGKRDVRALSFELWNSICECHPKWDRLYHACGI